MRLVIQRVNKAAVDIAGQIEKGLFVLVGVKKGDTKNQAEALASKLLKLRVMADAQDKMNLNIIDLPAGRQVQRASILAVSQFTLYAGTSGGNRPSFINAELPEKAKEIYNYFVEKLRESGVKVETGSFGDYMKIDIELDGPVTIILEN